MIQFKSLVKTLPVNEKLIDLALASEAPDFEDAVQIAVAEANEMNCIVTRDVKGFSHTVLGVFDTKHFLKTFGR